MVGINYNIDNDTRFLENLDVKYVDLLNNHGYPITPEQPKNVHKIGHTLGSEYNYYVSQAKQLHIQSKLALASGLDLDNFGLQFSLARDPGEDDDTYRLRLQAIFSPKKVTRPHINLVLSQISDVVPAPELFEPWRYVLHYDIIFPYDYRYDTGPWYLWDPTYWRSGTLVIKSGLTGKLYGIVEELVNAGIVIIYEQEGSSSTTTEEILPDFIGYQEDTVQLGTLISDRFWYDLLHEGYFDDPLSRFDISDLSLMSSYQDDNITSVSYFAVSNCFQVPVLHPGIWDEVQWDTAQWVVDDDLTPSHQSVLDNPWFQYDVIDPGFFLGNSHQLQYDFSQSSDFDTTVDADWDNDLPTVSGDYNNYDSTIFVITGWEIIDKCDLDNLFYEKLNIYSVDNMPLVLEESVGEYIYIENGVEVSELVFVNDLLDTEATYEINIFETLSIVDQVGIEYTEVVTESVGLFDLLQPNDTLVISDSVFDILLEGSTTLGDEVTLSDGRYLQDIPTITLSNVANLELEQFDIT